MPKQSIFHDRISTHRSWAKAKYWENQHYLEPKFSRGDTKVSSATRSPDLKTFYCLSWDLTPKAPCPVPYTRFFIPFTRLDNKSLVRTNKWDTWRGHQPTAQNISYRFDQPRFVLKNEWYKQTSSLKPSYIKPKMYENSPFADQV